MKFTILAIFNTGNLIHDLVICNIRDQQRRMCDAHVIQGMFGCPHDLNLACMCEPGSREPG